MHLLHGDSLEPISSARQASTPDSMIGPAPCEEFESSFPSVSSPSAACYETPYPSQTELYRTSPEQPSAFAFYGPQSELRLTNAFDQLYWSTLGGFSGLFSMPSTGTSFYMQDESHFSPSPSQRSDYDTLQPTSTRTESQHVSCSSVQSDHDTHFTSSYARINAIANRTCFEHGCNGRVFSSRSNLRRHQREKAQQARLLECPFCNSRFYRVWTRDQHVFRGSCRRFWSQDQRYQAPQRYEQNMTSQWLG